MDQYGDRLQYTGNLLSDLQTNIENISTNYVIHFPTTEIDFKKTIDAKSWNLSWIIWHLAYCGATTLFLN